MESSCACIFKNVGINEKNYKIKGRPRRRNTIGPERRELKVAHRWLPWRPRLNGGINSVPRLLPLPARHLTYANHPVRSVGARATPLIKSGTVGRCLTSPTTSGASTTAALLSPLQHSRRLAPQSHAISDILSTGMSRFGRFGFTELGQAQSREI